MIYSKAAGKHFFNWKYSSQFYEFIVIKTLYYKNIQMIQQYIKGSAGID